MLAALVATTACSSREEQAARSAATATALYEAKQYGAARGAIMGAIGKRDDIADYWVLLGRIDLALNRLGSAYYDYTRALELQAANAEALQVVAEVAFQMGRPEIAVSAADRLLALNPDATRATFIKGMVALNTRRFPEAIQFAETIRQQDPLDEGGIILLARAKALSGDRAAAIKLIDENLAKTGSTRAMLSALIEINRVGGDIETLIAAFEQLIAKEPGNQAVKLDYAAVLYKVGNAAEARALLSTILASDENNASLHRKVVDLWIANDSDALSAQAFRAIEASGPPSLRVTAARYKLAIGLPAQAASVLRALERRNDLPEARALYATALDAMGDSGRASAIVNDVLKSDKNNADALALRARLLIRSKEIRLALNDAQLLVRDHPEHEDGRVLLATVYVAKGEEWRARQIYEEAVRAMPLSAIVARAYVRFLNQRGDTQRAISVARNYTVVAPGSLRAWDLLAAACGRTGDTVCQGEASRGRNKALTTFETDQRPGAPRNRSLSGQL